MKKTDSSSRNSHQEGDIVIIAERIKDRVRKSDSEVVIGTVVHVEKNQVWVLLTNQNIWVGDSWNVYPYEESSNEQRSDLREESNSEDSID
jgi:hypothetical protein